MQPEMSSLVSDIRSASRDLVREFGLMNRTVAGTDLSVSAVHAIIEIGRAEGLSSKHLCEKLLLEKSTVSRMVKSLVEREEIDEVRSTEDARIKYLHLTRQGRKTLRAIDAFAETQVSSALDWLDDRSRRRVLNGLRDYASALNAASRPHDRPRPLDCIDIKTGYVPVIIGRVVEMFQSYMSEHFGFGAGFEVRIAADLAEFVSRIDASPNEIWRAEMDGEIVGSVSIDGQDLGDGLAHLRWFVVSDELRGCGAGKELLTRALAFCDERGFREIHLWTIKGLDSARSLYESHGFELVDEYHGDQWSAEVLEQKFIRHLPQRP